MNNTKDLIDFILYDIYKLKPIHFPYIAYMQLSIFICVFNRFKETEY